MGVGRCIGSRSFGGIGMAYGLRSRLVEKYKLCRHRWQYGQENVVSLDLMEASGDAR